MGFLCMHTTLYWWQTWDGVADYVGSGSSVHDEVEDEVQQQKEQDYGSWEEGR